MTIVMMINFCGGGGGQEHMNQCIRIECLPCNTINSIDLVQQEKSSTVGKYSRQRFDSQSLKRVL